MTGGAIVAFELCGRHNHPSISPARDYLLENQYKSNSSAMIKDYGNYYASHAVYLGGADFWVRWSPKMYEKALARQQKDGGWEDVDEKSRSLSTALIILALTSPHEHLAIFRRDKSSAFK